MFLIACFCVSAHGAQGWPTNDHNGREAAIRCINNRRTNSGRKSPLTASKKAGKASYCSVHSVALGWISAGRARSEEQNIIYANRGGQAYVRGNPLSDENAIRNALKRS